MILLWWYKPCFWIFFLYVFFISLLSQFTLFSCSIGVFHTSTVIGISAVIVPEGVGFVENSIGPEWFVCCIVTIEVYRF